MLSTRKAPDDVVDLEAAHAMSSRSPADLEYLTDPSVAHTMDPIEALDEEIAEAALGIGDVVDAARRLRRLRGLRRAHEEADHLSADDPANPQEVLQLTALRSELRDQLDSDALRLSERIAVAEAELASRIDARRDAVDRLRYLHLLRTSLTGRAIR
jgi:hypothetical protein